MADETLGRLESIIDVWTNEVQPQMLTEQRSRQRWRRWLTVAHVVQATLVAVAISIAMYVFVHGENERERLCLAAYAQADALVFASNAAQADEPPLTPDEQTRRQQRIAAYYAALDAKLEGICSPPNRNP